MRHSSAEPGRRFHIRRARDRKWLALWPPVSPAIYLRTPDRGSPFPLGEPDCRVYTRARHGLFEGARSLGIGAGDLVLAPAFHHGSEIEALIRTGARVGFYECDEQLAPDESSLVEALVPQTRALYLIHYLGFPQDGERWRRWCDERGLLLLEDAAQSWLAQADGRPVGSHGDLAIFCIYKSVGLDQPGALICREPPPAPRGRRASAATTLLAFHLAWLRQRIDFRGPARRTRYVGERPDASREFELGDPDIRPSAAALFAVRRSRADSAAGRRRQNYALLLERLAEHVPAPFQTLPGGASPLQFPLSVRDPLHLLKWLAHVGIEGGEPWPIPHPSLPVQRFPRAEEMRVSWIGLPVHHQLRRRDLSRICAAIEEALGMGPGP